MVGEDSYIHMYVAINIVNQIAYKGKKTLEKYGEILAFSVIYFDLGIKFVV